MRIKRFEGGTEAVVIEQVKNELGPQAIILSIKSIKAKGFLSIFKKPLVEVTAAYEEPGEILSDEIKIEVPGSEPVSKSGLEVGAKQVRSYKTQPVKTQPVRTNGQSIPAKSPLINGTRENDAIAALKENQAFAAGLKEMYKDRVIEEQAEKIKILEKNVLSAQEMLSRMNHKLSVEQHSIGLAPRRYKNNVVQVFFDSMLEQGVVEEAARAVLDGLDLDIEAAEKDGDVNVDVNIMVKMVYSNIISVIGKPRTARTTRIEVEKPTLTAAERVAGEPAADETASKSRKKKESKQTPFVAAFIGPTGVGKTTTIAKLSADFVLNKNVPVSLISADTYRIAAVEQLRTYADILNIELGVVYNPDDMTQQLMEMRKSKEAILIDTAGRSHKHGENMGELKAMLDAAGDCHKYLVLSLTTKFEDMLEIVETYAQITDFDIIFTKLDETRTVGSVLNLCFATGKTISYITFGQNVPHDIRVLHPEEVARAILCGL